MACNEEAILDPPLVEAARVDDDKLLELVGFRLQTSLTVVDGVFEGLRREELRVVEGVRFEDFEGGGAGLRFSSGYRFIACRYSGESSKEWSRG